MHYLMRVLLNKEHAANSTAARNFVSSYLATEALSRRARRRVYDGFAIGGEWTGVLSRLILDQQKLRRFEEEARLRLPPGTVSSVDSYLNANVPDEAMRRTLRREGLELFMKYFDDYRGEPPFLRQGFKDNGYEDDARIVDTDRQYYRWLGAEEGAAFFSNLECVSLFDIDETIVSPENVIGKKWIVVVDCHC